LASSQLYALDHGRTSIDLNPFPVLNLHGTLMGSLVRPYRTLKNALYRFELSFSPSSSLIHSPQPRNQISEKQISDNYVNAQDISTRFSMAIKRTTSHRICCSDIPFVVIGIYSSPGTIYFSIGDYDLYLGKQGNIYDLRSQLERPRTKRWI